MYRPVSACGLIRVRGERTRPGTEAKPVGFASSGWQGVACDRPKTHPVSHEARQHSEQRAPNPPQLHPDVPPQVLHFMQVPFRTSV